MIETRNLGSVLVVQLTEKRLDAMAAPAFKARILDFISGGADKVVLDLTNVTFLDSSGLGAVVGCLKALGNRGDLTLAGVQAPVMQLLKLTRMTSVFKIFPTAREAAGSLDPSTL